MSIRIGVALNEEDASEDADQLTYENYIKEARMKIKAEIRRIVPPKKQPSLAGIVAYDNKFRYAKEYVDSNYELTPSICFSKEATLRSLTNREMADIIVARHLFIENLLLEMDLLRIEYVKLVDPSSNSSTLKAKIIALESEISSIREDLGDGTIYFEYG